MIFEYFNDFSSSLTVYIVVYQAKINLFGSYDNNEDVFEASIECDKMAKMDF